MRTPILIAVMTLAGASCSPETPTGPTPIQEAVAAGGPTSPGVPATAASTDLGGVAAQAQRANLSGFEITGLSAACGDARGSESANRLTVTWNRPAVNAHNYRVRIGQRRNGGFRNDDTSTWSPSGPNLWDRLYYDPRPASGVSEQAAADAVKTATSTVVKLEHGSAWPTLANGRTVVALQALIYDNGELRWATHGSTGRVRFDASSCTVN